jgi:hypothetical protein
MVFLLLLLAFWALWGITTVTMTVLLKGAFNSFMLLFEKKIH